MQFFYLVGFISALGFASALPNPGDPKHDVVDEDSWSLPLIWSARIPGNALKKRGTANADVKCYSRTYYRNDGTSQHQYVEVVCY
ncbi:hypothetical protein MGYG_06929 [Nannizzia gypsea CBS 118893]|uniref:Uncharacterized protein n=1 Tax=Arthroderma gypseum (strain ATCC MYA-4604 / CBS 118893) TaxID=535722 RepID=E4V1L5_ARTGP|nr:hypothetical protein MGYG_06929 [Nannizzia gypsea CBS 118893]EFR03930.1 hypothetical protein MGYG_06929 [Nannizzia gypsea CBS 118893]